MIDYNEDGNGLPPELARAVSAMRNAPELEATWVRRVTTIAMAPRRTPRARRWTLTPMAALAAGLVCALIGAGATAVVMNARSRPAEHSRVATATPRVRFTIEAPGATSVSIVGDFNAWNPTSLPLRRGADGRTWIVEVPLAPGRYAYSFLVDGKLARDPAAPQARDDDFGSSNSVIMVKGS